MTLEKPVHQRRKDLVVFDILPLGREERREQNTATIAKLFIVWGVATLAVAVGAAILIHWLVALVYVGASVGYLAMARTGLNDHATQTLQATPASDDRISTRLLNLCRSAGIAPPAVFTVPGSGIDTATLAATRRQLFVTGEVSNLDELQLEALLAREVVRLRDGDAVVVAVWTILTDLAFAGGKWSLGFITAPQAILTRILGSGFLDPKAQFRADVGAAMLTRYPPATSELVTHIRTTPPDFIPRAWASSEPPSARAELIAEM